MHFQRLRQKSSLLGILFQKQTSVIRSKINVSEFLSNGVRLAKFSEVLWHFDVALNIIKRTSNFDFFEKPFFSEEHTIG